MRTIKFRGKNINTGEWIYGYFKKNSYGDCYIEDEYGLAQAVDPETVSQLVCVADEGDEIYVGDYINDFDDNFTMRVEWDEEDMQYVATEVYLTDEGFAADGDSFPLGEIVEMSPVGNIWDNEVETSMRRLNMIKRTPQEIADFFQCYVVQSGEEAQSLLISREKPTRQEHVWSYTWNIDGFVIGKEFFRVPKDHDWTKLYEPRNIVPSEKPVNKLSDEATHISEVFTHKEYRIVSAVADTEDLDSKVTKLMAEGWRPVGGVALMQYDDNHYDTFYQAMVRGV